VDGHLSIYLDDGQMVYRLLPYSGIKNVYSVDIASDMEYLFFAPEKAEDNSPKPDEMELFMLRSKEYNTLYLIFFEQDYYKPILKSEVRVEN
jgi:hypothetical protein